MVDLLHTIQAWAFGNPYDVIMIVVVVPLATCAIVNARRGLRK